MKIVFFGSFQNYSVQVLAKLINNFDVIAVVTTPPKPAGRHLQLTATKVEEFAKKNNILVYTLANLTVIPPDLSKPDFFIVAGYGKLIPSTWLNFPKVMSINVHFSLLPEYRGTFPAEWAILRGESQTGVTLIKMSPKFDQGEILVQEKIPIADNDTRQTLYQKLYDLGGELVIKNLAKIAANGIKPKPQPPGNYFYAKKITRDDGFIPWEEFIQNLTNTPQNLDRKVRAFSGWPGVWTQTPRKKRLKLISLQPEIMVQLEGKKPASFKQFKPAEVLPLGDR